MAATVNSWHFYLKLSHWYKGFGNRHRNTSGFLIHPKQTRIQNTGMYPNNRVRVNLVERHRTIPGIHNAQNMQHRLRRRIGTHTTNGHGNNNQQPNGETKGIFIQTQSVRNWNQVCVMSAAYKAGDVDLWNWST